MLKNRWWGLMCLCMTMALHGCPLEVEQEIGNNEDDAGQGEGGQGGNAEGGEGGAGAQGGQGGQGAEGGQGGQGGGEPGCPDGFESVDGPDQCDEGQECFELEDGRWCRGPLEPGECPDGYALAPECRPDADCIPLADGLFCVGEPQGGECPDGFQPVDECPADAECVLTNDGQMCARFGGPQGCPDGFEEVQDPDECFEDDQDLPVDPNGFGQCIEIDGRLCRQINNPQECPDGFELTDWCDEDRPEDECFAIDDGLFCQWIGNPQGCPPGFVEVQDPDECFEDGQDPADPDGFGRCIEIDGRLCRENNNPQDCPDGFELTDWCDEDQGNECFPIGDGLFCQHVGNPQDCPPGFVEVPECNDATECLWLDDGRMCQWFGQQGCPDGFEPVDNPDDCWWENGDGQDPDEAAPPAGECIEIDGVLCRPVDDRRCPEGFELTDWCDEDDAAEQQCFPIDDGLFCRWSGEQRCPNGADPVDEADCVDAAGNFGCDCIDSNGDGECDLWCRINPNPVCPDGFELTDWCDEDFPGECFPIDDGLFCRWNGEPQGCPQGFEQVDPDTCVDDNNNDRCECIDANGDGECDVWCREVQHAECPAGFELSDWCDEDFPGECFPIGDGLFCRWNGEPQGCPAGFAQVDVDQCIDDNNNNHCECIDGNGDGECDVWCREVNNPECPAGFELSDWCDADSPNECFEIGEGLFCQWVGEPQGCPDGFEQVDQCDPALGECFEAEDGTLCQQFGDPQECPDGYAEGCDQNHPGECIDLPNGQVCQDMGPGDGCPEGFEQAGADECGPDNQNQCVQTADGQWCIWRN